MTGAPGILAAYCRDGDEVIVEFTQSGLPPSADERTRWRALIEAARDLLTAAKSNRPGIDEVRLVLDRHTVLVRMQDSLVIAVVFLKGDAIVKSLPRMVRKTFRALAKSPPSPAPQPSPYAQPEKAGSLP